MPACTPGTPHVTLLIYASLPAPSTPTSTHTVRPRAPALPPPCSYELFEEAFEIYKKFGLKQQAIKVVLDHMEDLDAPRCRRRGSMLTWPSTC